MVRAGHAASLACDCTDSGALVGLVKKTTLSYTNQPRRKPNLDEFVWRFLCLMLIVEFCLAHGPVSSGHDGKPVCYGPHMQG